MNLDISKIVYVSELPGLYEIITPRVDGVIVRDPTSGKKRFISMRRYNIVPLHSISIFTSRDAVELKSVFRRMTEQYEDNPPPAVDADEETLRSYFEEIVPDYDPHRVSVGDIRKVIRWYHFLKEHGYIAGEE